MHKKFLSLAILSASTIQAIECPDPYAKLSCDPGYNTRATVRYRGPRGIGYDEGYTTFELFFSPKGQEGARAFVDLRAHIFDSGRWAANAGIGTRIALQQENAFGLNLYYDWRDEKHIGGIPQVGAGAEYLTPDFDIRVNGYAPVGGRKKIRDAEFCRLEGHHAIGTEKIDGPLPVLDAEMGIPFNNFYGNLYFAFGGYYLFENCIEGVKLGQAPGAKIRAQMIPMDSVIIGGFVSYDKIFDVRANGYVSISLPLGPNNMPSKGERFKRKNPAPCDQKVLRRGRFTQPVYRQEIIPVETDSRQFKIGFQDPCCCARFIVVDNSFCGFGCGTFEQPYKHLVDAERFSCPGDIIYVRPGCKPYNRGIVLKPKQTLVGSGVPLDICGICVPACTPCHKPVITNQVRPLPGFSTLPGFVGVITTEFNEINGICLDGSIVNGVFSGIDISIPNFVTICNTDIIDPLYGVISQVPKQGAKISIDSTHIIGVRDPIIDGDQFGSGGFVFGLPGGDSFENSTINISCSSVTGAPGYAVFFDRPIIDSEFNFAGMKIFGGHRGFYFGDLIENSRIRFRATTIQDINSDALTGSRAGIYFFQDIICSHLTFCSVGIGNMNLDDTTVQRNGIHFGTNSIRRNSVVNVSRCAFADIGEETTSSVGNAIRILEVSDSIVSITDSSFKNIANANINFLAGGQILRSDVNVARNKFKESGGDGLQISGAVNNSNITVKENSFKNAAANTALWDQQGEVNNSCLKALCNCITSGLTGFNFEGTLTDTALNFSGNRITNTTGPGINITGDLNRVGAMFCSNHIRNIARGISIEGVFTLIDTALFFTDNQFSNITTQGIFIDETIVGESALSFSGNKFRDVLQGVNLNLNYGDLDPDESAMVNFSNNCFVDGQCAITMSYQINAGAPPPLPLFNFVGNFFNSFENSMLILGSTDYQVAMNIEDNKTFNISSADVSIGDFTGFIDIQNNRFDGVFDLLGNTMCISLLNNCAERYDLTSSNLSQVESLPPVSQQSVQNANVGPITYNPLANFDFVSIGTCPSALNRAANSFKKGSFGKGIESLEENFYTDKKKVREQEEY